METEKSTQVDSNSSNPNLKNRIRELVENEVFQKIVIAIIVLNGLIIITETYLTGNRFLLYLDRIIVWIFVVELVVKVYGLGVKRYAKNGWNVFDFFVVSGSIIFYTTPFISALRLLRVLRLLRMIPAIPALRKIIDALLKSLPALGGIVGLSALIFSIYAIIGTTYFKNILPYEFFGSFHTSLFTLMQVVTFESWASQVARPVINEIPWAWMYFVSFIVIGGLVILNLVIAVILSYLGQEDEANREIHMERLYKENLELRNDIKEIKQILLNNNKRNM
ncbi:ion transporter [Desulfuribacillus alkaliarsenatis]|uniref:Ion transporter n=1 Tax=Desulfuribacillus alkaliarsenatis TaxID=766136 RepID=A0A1E5G2U8_9FIRM|nr:ion transporter [Desulfuribacillus alkaliarsenatis]OEF97373.1 ion transporter [Desulfuribacillus alkaliarsenatis]